MAKHQLVQLEENQWVQLVDERELKKQKRKQSNRELACRARLHKQVECEELGGCHEALRSENSLRAELERIRKEYEQLLSWNASLKEKLGATSDSIPDMNEQNNGDGNDKIIRTLISSIRVLDQLLVPNHI